MKLEDYGFLSDTETAALVGRNGSIDWLCMPRFDSPACFAKLLGTEDNGYWQIAPEGAPMAKRRHYRDGSLVLETEFETDDGIVRLIDFMPLRGEFPEIVRIVEGCADGCGCGWNWSFAATTAARFPGCSGGATGSSPSPARTVSFSRAM